MKKVKGYPGFVKDPETGVVQNTNTSELERAKAAKKKILNDMKRTEMLESKVEKLESMLEELLARK